MSKYTVHRAKSGNFWIYDKFANRSTQCTADGTKVSGPALPYYVTRLLYNGMKHVENPYLFRHFNLVGFPQNIVLNLIQNDHHYAKIYVQVLGHEFGTTITFYRDVLGVMISQSNGITYFVLEWTEEQYDKDMPNHPIYSSIKHLAIFD